MLESMNGPPTHLGGRIVAIKVVSDLGLTGRHDKRGIAYSFVAFGTADISGYTYMRLPCR